MPSNSWDSVDEDTPLVKRLRQEIEKRDGLLADKDKVLAEQSLKIRTQTVGDVLRDIGAKPGLAKFIPSTVETSKESVTAWLKENEEIFGPLGTQSADGQTQTAPDVKVPAPASNPLAPAVTADQIAAFQRMANADTNATTLPDVESAHIAQLQSMFTAANGDADTYLAFLRGDMKLQS